MFKDGPKEGDPSHVYACKAGIRPGKCRQTVPIILCSEEILNVREEKTE